MGYDNWNIINGCTMRPDEWYRRGQARLKESVRDKINCVTYRGFPNYEFEQEKYNIKASSMYEASKTQAKLFWMDCSVYLSGNHNNVFRMAENEGYYFINNGYNCAQECNDECLEYFEVTRDEAENIKCVSSGFFALDLNRPECQALLDDWLKSCKDGIWKGSREHDGQSSDPRFLHHRQDQSALSLLVNRYQFKMHALGDEIAYYPDSTKNWLIHGCSV
jgi:hypothetical protein